MEENNGSQKSSISNAETAEEIGQFWDDHSLADHWDETREVQFEVRAQRRIALDPEVYARLEQQAVSLASQLKRWSTFGSLNASERTRPRSNRGNMKCSDRPSTFTSRPMNLLKQVFALTLAVGLVHSLAFADNSIRDYRRAHEHEILREFMELLRIPNVAGDRENIRRNATAIIAMMQRRSFNPAARSF